MTISFDSDPHEQNLTWILRSCRCIHVYKHEHGVCHESHTVLHFSYPSSLSPCIAVPASFLLIPHPHSIRFCPRELRSDFYSTSGTDILGTENTLLVDYGLAASRTKLSHSVLVSFLPTLYSTQSWCMILESFSFVIAVLLVEPRQKLSPPSRFYVLLPAAQRAVRPHVLHTNLVDPAAPATQIS